MKVEKCLVGGLPGYRQGNEGTFYSYDWGDEESEKVAKSKAESEVVKGRRTQEVVKYDSVYLDDGTTIETRNSVYISEPIDFSVIKAKDNKTVFGWANVAVDKNGELPFEWQDDVIPPSVLEKAAYEYVLKYRGTGEEHEGDVVGTMIESCMFTKQKMEVMGIPEGTVPEGWWIGFHVPDEEAFAKVKDGTYQMFSIQGNAKKIKV